jgi:hypothetical protein
MSVPGSAAAGRELALDRRLRREDWRYLHPGLPLERVEHPSEAALGRIVSRAGGSGLYLEWTRPLLGGGKALRRRLHAAGLRDVELYWPWPGLHRPWFWLPLGSEAAIGYIGASRLPARSAWRRALDRPLRALWRRAAAAERLWPLCAVVGPATPAGAAEPLRRRLEREWPLWGLDTPPSRLSWLLLTRGGRSINKVVGLVFAEPDPVPRVVVKLARVPQAEEGLRREAGALDAVHARTPGGVRGAPRVLFCDSSAGPLALAETALPGRPLFAAVNLHTHRALAIAATDWLGSLANARAPVGAADHVVESALRDFAARFESVLDPAELRAAERLVAPLLGLPSVPEHRDFSPWNVHVAPEGGLVVYDWESAEPAGLPLIDLVYFLAYLAFFQEGTVETARCAKSYRRARDPSTFTGAVHQECVERYVARVGLDPGHVRSLHALTWLIHSRSEYDRLAADAGGPPSTDVLHRSLFLALWREELRR